MALEDDILKLLKAEGYRVNEAVKDALDEFIELVEEENENLEESLDSDDKEEEEPDE
jgi:hypothetical protein